MSEFSPTPDMLTHVKDVTIGFTYTNYRGVKEDRVVSSPMIVFGNVGPFHGNETTWYLHAFDTNRNSYRRFLLRDIIDPVGVVHIPSSENDPAASTRFVYELNKQILRLKLERLNEEYRKGNVKSVDFKVGG